MQIHNSTEKNITKHTRYALKNCKKPNLVSESTDQTFAMFNEDMPLKKMQSVLRILTGLDLNKIELQMAMVASGGPKGVAVPMVNNNGKIAHHHNMILNNRGITGGPACYPRKCAKIVLRIIRYFKSMKKIMISETTDQVILYLKSASATKGDRLKRINMRSRGQSDIKYRQKVNIRAVAGILIVKKE